MESDSKSRTLAVGNSNGYVIVFEVNSQQEWKPIHNVAPRDEIPVTSIGIIQRSGLSNLYAVGFANGSVKIINPEKGNVLAEISSHSRGLNALVCHPNKPVFASCSDDTFVNVFAISSEREDLIDVNLVLSSRVNDYQLVGLTFSGDNSNSLIAAPYDYRTLAIWNNIIP
jgi:WD40 repeat protein